MFDFLLEYKVTFYGKTKSDNDYSITFVGDQYYSLYTITAESTEEALEIIKPVLENTTECTLAERGSSYQQYGGQTEDGGYVRSEKMLLTNITYELLSIEMTRDYSLKSVEYCMKHLNTKQFKKLYDKM